METQALAKGKPVVAGFYPGVSPTIYHKDPAPAPSLSSSICKVLLEKSPLHAWVAHPRLNPNHEADDATKFDKGNAAHAILFGAGKKLRVIEADDWRKDATKKARDDAIAAGFSPILSSQYAEAQELAELTRKQIVVIDGCEDFFERSGLHIFNEVMMVWQDEGGIWCRQLLDRLCVSAEAITVFDLKTTSANVAPHEVGRYQYDQNHQVQAAFAERGLQTLFSNPVADRLKVNFIVQEASAPYQLTVNEVDLTIGRRQVSQAIHLWRTCLEEKRWPGYPRQILKQHMPGFIENKWLEREANDPAIRNFATDPFLTNHGSRVEAESGRSGEPLLAG